MYYCHRANTQLQLINIYIYFDNVETLPQISVMEDLREDMRVSSAPCRTLESGITDNKRRATFSGDTNDVVYAQQAKAPK
jgi:hypothetical protein